MYTKEINFKDLMDGNVVELDDGKRLLVVRSNYGKIWFVDDMLNVWMGKKFIQRIVKVYDPSDPGIDSILYDTKRVVLEKVNGKMRMTVRDVEKLVGCPVEIIADSATV